MAEIKPANTLDDYLASLTAARAALSDIGAPAYHSERLLEIADLLLEQRLALQQEIAEAIEDVCVSVVRDPARHQREVCQAIIDLATALESQPADEARSEACFAVLAHRLGGVDRALGVCDALHRLCWSPPDEDSAEPVLAA